MSDANRKLEEAIQSFIRDIKDLVNEAALEAVKVALGGKAVVSKALPKVAPKAGKAAKAAPKALAKPAKAAPKAAVKAAPKAAVKAAPKAASPGAKRSPEEIEHTTSTLIDYVKKNPGLRIEQLAKSLSVPSKDLQLPVRKLIQSGKMRTQGQKRSTQYFAL